MIRAFISANQRICWAIQRSLPHARIDLHYLYEKVVTGYMNAGPNLVVVDVGGGRSCPFARHRLPEMGARIVALDVSAKELAYNKDVDEKRVADITRELPFEDGEVDMVVSRSVLEHLEDVRAFAANSHRVMRPGGIAVHVMPSRYAPFAIVNRLLPSSVSRRIVLFFEPFNEGICGFPAHYDRCYYSAITRTFREQGFELLDVRVNYYQSKYYDFFVPLYLLSVLYELLVRALNAKNLGASVLIVARRGEEAPEVAGHAAQDTKLM